MSPAEKKVFQRRAKEANEAWKRQQKEQEAAQAADVSAALQSGSIPPSTNTQVHQASPFTILPGQQSTPTSDPTHHLGGQQQQLFTAGRTSTSSLDQRPPPSTFPTTSMGAVSTSSPPRCPQGGTGGLPGFSLVDSPGTSTPQALSSTAGTPQSGVSGPNPSSSFGYLEARGKDSAQTPPHPLSHPTLQGGGSGRLTPPSSPYQPIPSSRGSVLPSPSGVVQQHRGSPLPAGNSSIHLLQAGSVRPSPYASLGKRDLATALLEESAGSGMPVQKKQRGDDREQQDPSSVSGGYASSQSLLPGRAGLERSSQQQPSLPPRQHALPSLGERDLAGGIIGNGNLLDRREGLSSSSTHPSLGVIRGEGGVVPGRSVSSSCGEDGTYSSSPAPHHQHLHHQPFPYNNLNESGGDKRTFSSLSSASPSEPMNPSSFSSQQTPLAPVNHHGAAPSSAVGDDGGILHEGRGQSYVSQQEALSPPPGSLPPAFSRGAQNRGGEGDGDRDRSMPLGSSNKPGGGVFSDDRGGGLPVRMLVSHHHDDNLNNDSLHLSRDPWNEARDREEARNAQADNRTRQFVSDPVCTAVPPSSPRMRGTEGNWQHTSLMYEEHPLSMFTWPCLYRHHSGEKKGELRGQSECGEATLNFNGEVAIDAQEVDSGMREVYTSDYKEEEIPSSSAREIQTSLLFHLLPLTPPLEETEAGVKKTSVEESSSDVSSEGTRLDLDEKTMTGCVQLDIEEETGRDCRAKGNARRKRFRAEALVEAVPPERERRARDSREARKEEPRKPGKMTNGEETRRGRQEKNKRQSHREELESEEDESDEEEVEIVDEGKEGDCEVG